MPPASTDTERGSRVRLRKRKRQESLRDLLEAKLRCPALSLRQLALEAGIDRTTAAKRWRVYEEARAAGRAQEDALDDATTDRRGGHNRAFSTEHAQLLRQQVLSLPAATHESVRTLALQLKQGVELAEHVHRQQLRSDAPPFVASPAFITRFKRQHRISSRRTKVVHKARRQAAERDTAAEAWEYRISCAAAA